MWGSGWSRGQGGQAVDGIQAENNGQFGEAVGLPRGGGVPTHNMFEVLVGQP